MVIFNVSLLQQSFSTGEVSKIYLIIGEESCFNTVCVCVCVCGGAYNSDLGNTNVALVRRCLRGTNKVGFNPECLQVWRALCERFCFVSQKSAHI